MKRLLNLLQKNVVVFALFFIVGFGIYGNVLTGDFMWDDVTLIEKNTHVHSLSHFSDWFTTHAREGAGRESNLYRPFATMGNAITYTFFEFNPMGYHARNVLLHIVNAFLVFILFGKFGFARFGSILGALFFLVHPVNTENASYISGLPDLLVTMFILAGVITFSKKESTPLSMGLSLLWAICALLSKETGILMTGFAAITLLYFKPEIPKQELKKKSLTLVGIAAIGVIYVILKFTALNFTDQVLSLAMKSSDYTENIFLRIGIFIQTIYDYVVLIIFPVDLYFEKEFIMRRNIFTLRGLFGFAVILSGLALAVRSYRKERVFFLGYAWVAVSLSLVCGILISNAIYAERWLYLPLIGILLIVPHTWQALEKKKNWQKIFAVICLLCIVILGVRTIYRNQLWANPKLFFKNEIRLNPHSPRTESSLGRIYFYEKNYERAKLHFENAVEKDPQKYFARNRYNLGNTHFQLGEVNSAIKYYLLALEVDPNYLNAHLMLSDIYFDSGYTGRALKFNEFSNRIKKGDTIKFEEIVAVKNME